MARYENDPTGVVWNNDPYQRTHPYNQQAGRLFAYTLGAGAASAAMFARVRIHGVEDRLWGHASRLAQVAERAIPPFQWTRTFRWASRMAPMAGPNEFTLGAEHFARFEHSQISGKRVSKAIAGTEKNYMMRYFEGITGMKGSQLVDAGLLEKGITFKREGLVSGNLFIGEKKVASNIVLGRFAEGTVDPVLLAHISTYDPKLANDLDKVVRKQVQEEIGLNTVRSSKVIDTSQPFTEQGMRKSMRGKPAETILHYRNKAPEWIPMTIGPAGEAHWLKNVPEKLLPGLAGVRTNTAWAAQRLDMTVRATLERMPFIGKKAAEFLPKKASFFKMQWKYAGMAAVVGAAALAIDELDWFKRNRPTAGSAAYGGVAGAATLAMGAHPYTAMMAAAGTAVATSAPGMEKGIKQGIANYYMKAELARSRITNALPIRYAPVVGHKYREFIGETFSGADTPEMAFGAGLMTWGAAAAYWKYNQNIRLGKGGLDEFFKSSYRSQWEKVMASYGFDTTGAKAWGRVFRGEYKPLSLKEMKAKGISPGLSWFHERPKTYFEASMKAHQAVSNMIKRGIAPVEWTKQGAHRVPSVLDRIRLDTHWAEKVRDTEGTGARLWAQLRATAEGANIHRAFSQRWGEKAWMKTKTIPLGRAGLAVTAGALLWAAATGQFASKDTPEELRAKMSGEKPVEIRRGRYWESGGTPFKGQHIMYHRPHWYAMMSSRAKQKAIWGPDEDKLSPVRKWFTKNFTYELAKQHYQDRPYPITGSAFQEMPFAAALMRPIGNLIKPPRLMHVEDWAMYGGSAGGTELMHHLNELESQPAEGLGGFGPGAPISPFSGRAVVGQQHYQWAEQAGLVGYMHMQGFGLNPFALKSMIGTDTLYSQDNWLESANKMHSVTRSYWDAELGGMLFLSEAFRRFYPRPRSELGSYNPIANTMPFWVPEQLRYGDPYSIPSGEVRMPGPGYAAIHPDLEGIAPENYPLWHQYAILSDVAWWSREFRHTQAKVRQLEEAGALSPAAQEIISGARQRLEDRQQRLQFDNYVNKYNQETANWSGIRRGAARTWQAITHGMQRAAEPVEYISPFGVRPFSKLGPGVSPVEEYERSQVYGTRFSFWDKLGRDWVRPAVWSAARNMGYEGIPPHLQEVREDEEYFDKLEYYKWQTLAHTTDDPYLRQQYEGLARKTVYGRNPYENSMYVKSSLPRREKDYYEAFVNTTNPAERERILQLVPEHMRSVYVAQWAKTDYERTGDPKLLEAIKEGHSSGGYPMSEELWRRYKAEAEPGQSYADWYRMREVGEYFDTHPLPRANWVGFSPEVDLQDVKLKMVLSEGKEPHDYGLWDSQVRALARKPYINDGTIEPVQHNAMTNRRILRGLAAEHGMPSPQIQQYEYYSPFPRNDISFDLYDNRQSEITDTRKLLGL